MLHNYGSRTLSVPWLWRRVVLISLGVRALFDTKESLRLCESTCPGYPWDDFSCPGYGGGWFAIFSVFSSLSLIRNYAGWKRSRKALGLVLQRRSVNLVPALWEKGTSLLYSMTQLNRINQLGVSTLQLLLYFSVSE